MALTPKQRAQLRSLAHHLKPVHQIGKEGVSPATIRAVEDAFRTRELLKVRVQEAAPLSARETGPELVLAVEGAEHVQTIGRVVVLYRRHPDNPRIELVKD